MINKIHNENCIETMSRMPDGYIDLTITSPPYNLGDSHHTGNNKFKAYDEYNDNMPEDKYQECQIKILNELFRITADTGSIFYNHKNRIKNGIQITPYQWLLKTKWHIKQELVWFNGSQNFDKIRFYPMTERVYWLAKNPEVKLFNAINHHDLFTKEEWKAEGVNKAHKRSFPERMIHDILKCFPSSKIIYDPYSGSGTTLKVAVENGKEYIGSELSEKYCKMAQERINIFTSQGQLFQ